MYITYDEYIEYGGTLDESTFTSLYYQAQIKLDYYTYNRLKENTEFSVKIKLCLTKLISLLYTYTQYEKTVTDINKPVISSQSNDGVSVSYGGYLGNTSPQDIDNISKKLEQDIKHTIKQYLFEEVNQKGETLLYRGVYR